MSRNDGETMKVMVVDDEEHIRLAVDRILSRQGCQVSKAANGQEALSILEQEPIEVVFLDLMMPGMDGMEVHKHIKDIDPSILVIIITGYATVETAIEAMKQGAYDFIPKPFEAEQLRIVASRALEKIDLTREAERLEEERRKTLFDLSTEKSRTRSIVEAMPNGVLVTNAQGQVVLMNQAARRHLELDDTCRIGGRVQEYIADDSLCQFVGRLAGQQAPQDLEPHEFEVSSDTFLLVRANPINGDDGSYLGSVIILVDISAIKKLDRLKSEFVAKVSHELRSPLSTIHEQMAMVIQDMLDHEQSDRDQRILSRMQERTKGLIALVEDLLDLSRLEAGAAYQDVQAINLDQVLTELVAFYDSQAKSKDQTLGLELPEEGLPEIQADPKAVESVFSNLVSNAIKYTQEGGSIRVEARSEDGQVKVLIEDNGFGIDQSSLERVFERFYRVKNEKTRFISGTGLGLPIVKGILDDLGGSITVDSQPGQGSVFTVSLPVSS
jgi:PAS domain S-box-containing protein